MPFSGAPKFKLSKFCDLELTEQLRFATTRSRSARSCNQSHVIGQPHDELSFVSPVVAVPEFAVTSIAKPAQDNLEFACARALQILSSLEK